MRCRKPYGCKMLAATPARNAGAQTPGQQLAVLVKLDAMQQGQHRSCLSIGTDASIPSSANNVGMVVEFSNAWLASSEQALQIQKHAYKFEGVVCGVEDEKSVVLT